MGERLWQQRELHGLQRGRPFRPERQPVRPKNLPLPRIPRQFFLEKDRVAQNCVLKKSRGECRRNQEKMPAGTHQ